MLYAMQRDRKTFVEYVRNYREGNISNAYVMYDSGKIKNDMN
jgi:hypothetical protein